MTNSTQMTARSPDSHHAFEEELSNSRAPLSGVGGCVCVSVSVCVCAGTTAPGLVSVWLPLSPCLFCGHVVQMCRVSLPEVRADKKDKHLCQARGPLWG